MKQEHSNGLQKRKRYGILGGTFDPIHNGHLFIAQQVLEELELDHVIFIPNRVSPLKNEAQVTSPYHRGIMTEIATLDNPCFHVSPMELYRSGPSYSIETVQQLMMENPDTDFFFIAGTDVLMDLDSWKDYKELLNLVTFVVVTRAGFMNEALDQKIQYFIDHFEGSIIKLTIPLIEISSTSIRNRVKAGQGISYWVPAGVEAYIKKHGLYLE